ncbi:MAG: tyrosine-type recombinase/integrase [Janthinobacterium lividum]
MPTIKLNQRAVDALAFEGKRNIVWDAGTPGFGVIVYATSKAYTVQYRVDGQSRRVNLGSTAEHSFKAARDKAADILQAARKGTDLISPPVAKRVTFQACAEEWMKLKRPEWSPATYEDYEDRFSRLIFARQNGDGAEVGIGAKALQDVSPVDVEKLHASMVGSPRNQSYTVTLIKAVFNYAVRAKHLDPSHHNPANLAQLPRNKDAEPKEQRVLTGPEVEKLGKALAAMEAAGEVSPHLAGLLRISLLCGLRPGEARSVKWENVDLDSRIMRVTGKTGTRRVPLSDAAVEVLKRVHEYRQAANPYVFIGRVTGQHLVGIAKQLDRIAERAGVPRFNPYVFRHSAATQSLAGGADVRAVQALLGHTDLKTTMVYLHADEDRKRKAVGHVEAFAKAFAK